MKVLLINPPRYYWPYLSDGDNYILPQALPCLAAVLRENDVDVKPIDCLPIKMGWNTLERMIEREQPDVVGVTTSETMFTPEGVKLCNLVKKIDPSIKTVVGGAHFSNLAEESVKKFPIDFVVVGEGEYTLLELVKELDRNNQNLKKVKGLVFKKDKDAIRTKPRPLIENLDDLPIPAYDLMPMKLYGKEKLLFSPGGTTIHHSRGCVHNCKFCVWWVQMSQRKIQNGKEICHPKWRTKSVERTLDEVEILCNKYKKKYLEFVDDTWNVNPDWNIKFAENVKERGLNFKWFGFMRADYILRDEKKGIFKDIVDSGLVKLCIGAERSVDEDLTMFGKKGYSHDITKKCFHLLRDKYPEVFRQGTFILGVRNETKESMYKVLEYAKELDLDFPSFHPITPIPGTETWDIAQKNNWIEEKNYINFDWLTPIMSSEHMTREEIFDTISDLTRKYVTLRWYIRGLTSSSRFKRNMYLWFTAISRRVFFDEIKNKVYKKSSKNKIKNKFTELVKPEWYDS